EVPETFTKFRKQVESDFAVTPPKDDVREIPIPSAAPALDTDEFSGRFEEFEVFTNLDFATDPRAAIEFRGGESRAWERLQSYFWDQDQLRVYKTSRNGMLGADYSSKFSPWLAHGCLSPRQIYAEVQRYESERVANESTYWLVFELLWRDYFALIVAKHGNKAFQIGGLRRQLLPWKQDPELFDRWRDGKTGFPLIDANMLELATTGFMSNRGRQNVASFLTKNLGIDWRMGAEWFESMLIDFDPCSNYGNWNYAAGVGNDARGFRWFNTLKQSRDYDPNGSYVRHWIPCLSKVPNEFVHEPWTLNPHTQASLGYVLDQDYPSPVVDLIESASRNEELYHQEVPIAPSSRRKGERGRRRS
ncbi:MAG: DASH family cryptochrome, partial [Planctomycetota bacterium]